MSPFCVICCTFLFHYIIFNLQGKVLPKELLPVKIRYYMKT